MAAARPARGRRRPAKKAAAKPTRPPLKLRACAQCGTEFEAARSTAKYCGATCRSRARRRPAADTAVVGLVDEVTKMLTRAQKLASIDGQQALIVARRMESGAETGAAVTALSKELSRLMAVVAGSSAALDPLDELARRRDDKAAHARKATR